jgi:hypothetical protein
MRQLPKRHPKRITIRARPTSVATAHETGRPVAAAASVTAHRSRGAMTAEPSLYTAE